MSQKLFLVRCVLNVVHTDNGRTDQVRYDGLVRGDSADEVAERLRPFGFDFSLAPIEETSIEDLPEAIKRHLADRNVELALTAGAISQRQPPPCLG